MSASRRTQENHQLDLEKAIDWDKWFYSPGMPEGMTELFDDSLMGATVALKEVWVAGGKQASSYVEWCLQQISLRCPSAHSSAAFVVPVSLSCVCV